MTQSTTQCGFIAMIGAPNAGKSCLTNALTGQKISIVTAKVQTTRTRITGIVTENNAQAVFIDTPGIFKPRRRLDKAMVAAAHDAHHDADITAIVIDVSRKDCMQTAVKLAKRIGDMHKDAPLLLVLNKVDLIAREKLLPIAAKLNEEFEFAATFMLSAKTGNGVAGFKEWVLKNIPDGPFHYDPETASDIPDRLFTAEITREKLFERLHQELPYGLNVETESLSRREDGSMELHQNILISEKRHKGMVIGKGGALLKTVGQLSRHELEDLFECRVHLYLQVIVRNNWDQNYDTISSLGLDPNAS